MKESAHQHAHQSTTLMLVLAYVLNAHINVHNVQIQQYVDLALLDIS